MNNPVFENLTSNEYKENFTWSDDMGEFLEESSQHHYLDKYNRRIVQDALEQWLLLPNTSFIDIGCGPGYLLQDLFLQYAKINPSLKFYGSDFLASSLVRCHARLPMIPLIKMDLEKCPIQDQKFDAISCLNVLEHLEDDVAGLKHLYRILKVNGKIAITVPLGPHLVDCYDEVHGHFRRYSMEDLLRKIISAGFIIEKKNTFGFFLYPLFYIVKRYNQFRFRYFPIEKKQALAFKQAKNIKLLNFLCFAEQILGKFISFPKGIRGYVVATKK